VQKQYKSTRNLLQQKIGGNRIGCWVVSRKTDHEKHPDN
jgi:hypothetical protein